MQSHLSEQLQNPKGCKAAVVGAGISGQSAAMLLQKLGAQVTVFDEKTGDVMSEVALLGFDFIVLSPGFPRSKPVIIAALNQKIPIVNEIDLAYVHLPECRIIAVTGTNGKSTTTAMIGEILKTRDPLAFVGGNLGRPMCDAILNGESPKLAVLELSSYQLETISIPKLDVALVTNLAPDHLDRYSSVESYYQSKNKIFSLLHEDGTSITNQKDSLSAQFLHPHFNHIFFDGTLTFPMPHMVGAHNLENASAAVAATRAMGFTDVEIASALTGFRGISHRLELLGTYKGVRWYNDSKATNVESSIKAVESFEGGVHLILGGQGKGASYEPLVYACRGLVQKIYAIGADAPKIEAAFAGKVPLISVGNLDNAVTEAVKNSSNGDVILLAPACASFDQYKNYEERGEHFRRLFENHSGVEHA